MPVIRNFPHLLHGGDYNPDQWLNRPGTLDDDFRLMELAHCNTFSVGIFAWGVLEPEEGRFEFGWLDEVMDRAAASGKKIFLATPTGARPGWLGCGYPETGRMDAQGLRARWTERHNHCWTSPVMREKTAVIDAGLAERYAGHPALGGWHVSNEYSGECFCPSCLEKFHGFLKERYGTLKELNRRYWSNFWSHTFSDWSQVNPADGTTNTALLDWRRFNTRQLTDFLRWEIDHIRQYSDAPVTTNMMGFFLTIDYWRVAECCDFISDDRYPDWRLDPELAMADLSMVHDMHYTMKNKPFVMMESCPGVPNYFPYPRMRRPNELEREMLAAIGHGADGTLYFQWRKGLGGCEKFHGAVVGHDNTDATRTFRDVAGYGRKLERIAGVIDAGVQPEVAVIHDWESNWALEASTGFGGVEGKQVPDVMIEHYRALYRHNAPIAVIDSLRDFTPYKVVVAPQLFMLRPGVAERMEAFVAGGGILVMSCLSGYVDDDNQCFPGGNPGGPALRRLFGIWNEDIDSLPPGVPREVVLTDGGRYPVERFAEYLHLEGAESVAGYSDEFFREVPAVTRRRHGKGEAWYIGCRAGVDFLAEIYRRLLHQADVRPVLPQLPPEIRASRRGDYIFLYNLNDRPVTVTLPQPMRDVWNGGTEAVNAVAVPASGATVLTQFQ